MKFRHLPGIARRPAAFLLLVALGCLSLGAAAQGPVAEIERGRQLYMSNSCFTCHGTVGQGGERSAGPPIAPQPQPLEAFKAMVRNPAAAMPRFEAQFLSDEQLQAIHRYLASMPKGRSAKEIPLLQPPG